MSARPAVPEVTLRPIAASDRPKWEPLWAGYLAFYEKTVAPEVTELLWKRLITTGEIQGFVAVKESGEVLGIVHFYYHVSTSTLGGNCYLQDLFVTPESRGLRVGRRLIEAVRQAAKAEGAAVLYWQTEEFNGTARRLYERVAKRAPFIRYNIDL